MREVPVLVGIEGIDAAGKSTQIAALQHALAAAHIHFPNYDSVTGQWIKQELQANQADPMVRQAVFAIDKYDAAPGILQMLNLGFSFILDRYFASAMTYGKVDGLDVDWLWNIHSFLPMPDVYFLLDIDAEESFRRRPAREDAYEADKAGLDRVVQAYRELYNAGPITRSWRDGMTEWVIIDGTQPPEDITQQMLAKITEIQTSVK